MRLSPLCLLAALGLAMAGCAPSVGSKTGTTAGAHGAAIIGDAEAGRLVYDSNCSTCHGPTGVEGGGIGPALRDEKSRMDFGATVSWIEDPAPPMPKLYPKMLTVGEVHDVAAYVQSL